MFVGHSGRDHVPALCMGREEEEPGTWPGQPTPMLNKPHSTAGKGPSFPPQHSEVSLQEVFCSSTLIWVHRRLSQHKGKSVGGFLPQNLRMSPQEVKLAQGWFRTLTLQFQLLEMGLAELSREMYSSSSTSPPADPQQHPSVPALQREQIPPLPPTLGDPPRPKGTRNVP